MAASTFVLVTIWVSDLRAQLAASEGFSRQEGVRQEPSWFDAASFVPKRNEPELYAPARRIPAIADGDNGGLRKKLIQRGGSDVEVIDDIRSTSGPIFVPEDINNPTKIQMPPNGFPPSRLPPAHRNAEILERIRKMSKLSPRWPKHPGMHAIELRSSGPAYSSIVVSHLLKVIYVPVFKPSTL